jgi:enhancing lycopene biosynthesis protein 2
MADATIYNPARDLDQMDIKKRKRGLDSEIVNGYGADENAGNGAVYTGQVKTNAHLRTIHTELKVECEELGNLCVGSSLRHRSCHAPLKTVTGEAEVVGKSDYAQVSPILSLLYLHPTRA